MILTYLCVELDNLKRYKPEMNDMGHKYNYCSNLEIEFFDHEKSLCQLCLNSDNRTLRLNYLVYEASPELISFFWSLHFGRFGSSGFEWKKQLCEKSNV